MTCENAPVRGDISMSHSPYGCEMRRKGISVKYLSNFFSCKTLGESINDQEDAFFELACKTIIGDMDTHCDQHGLLFLEANTFGEELRLGLVVMCPRCGDGDFVALDDQHRLVMGQVGVQDQDWDGEATADETSHDPYDCEMRRKGVSAKHLDDFHDYMKLDDSLQGQDNQFLTIARSISLSEMSAYRTQSGFIFSYDLDSIGHNLKIGLMVACPRCALADVVALNQEDRLAIAQVEFLLGQSDQEASLQE